MIEYGARGRKKAILKKVTTLSKTTLVNNIVKVFVFTAMLSLTVYIPAFATTYQADTLEQWQHFNAGDVIQFGSGEYGGDGDRFNYDRVDITLYNSYYNTHPRIGSSSDEYTLPCNCYLSRIDASGTILNGQFVDPTLYLHFSSVKCGLYTATNELVGDVIDIHRGETKRLFFRYEGEAEPPTRLIWSGVRRDREIYNDNWEDNIIYENENRNYIDIHYNEYYDIGCRILGSNGRPSSYLDNGCLGGAGVSIIRNIDEPESNEETENTSNNVIDKKDTDKDDDKGEKDDNVITEDKQPTTPQTPSTVPYNTVQVSLDSGNKGLSNIKALTPFIHDSVNQKILADLYAKNLKKRANVLMQKNLIPPYGVDGTWKNQSHTVKWKDLTVKKGDQIVIIWYTPMFGIHAPTLKYIPATVVEDGTIEFTIPAMGDMSVMSIVKLI